MSAWVSTPPVTARVSSTMVNAIPFLWLKGWHAPAGRRTREPRPLAQDGQIRPARRWVPQKPGTRPAERSEGQPKRRQPIRRSGRDPGHRPYARITAKPRKQGRKHYPHPPCRLWAVGCGACPPVGRAQISWFWVWQCAGVRAAPWARCWFRSWSLAFSGTSAMPATQDGIPVTEAVTAQRIRARPVTWLPVPGRANPECVPCIWAPSPA